MLALLLFLSQATAQTPVLDEPVAFRAPRDDAEFQRQSSELQLAATRNAWGGVERAYRALMTTNVPLTGAMHLCGARAAQSRGDMTAARDRVRQALQAEPELQEASDWLRELDSGYASVLLLGDPGRHQLLADATPFDPALAKAIEFARTAIADTGTFNGILPAGSYRFADLTLDVRPGITTQRIDLRSDRTLRRTEREERR
jgi:hypothetical protein